MASEKPENKEKKDKKDKKEKKEKKRSEIDGVHKAKKDKKEKKEKKGKLIAALDEQLQADAAVSAAAAGVLAPKDVEEANTKPTIPGAMVPFAIPLADEKATKKVLKSIRKCMYPYLLQHSGSISICSPS
jgi:H/ACA ribonucleoprotein complex subunit 2